MTDSLKITLAQLNPVVGDIDGNIAKIKAARLAGAVAGAHLVIGTELCVTGYPPEDLILKSAFVRASMDSVGALATETADGGPGLVVGSPWFDEDGNRYNAAVVLDEGKVQTVRYKWDLPNYGVFDEKRIFKAGELPGPVNFRGVRLGLAICEDMWTPDVCETLMESGAEILIIINGSPYERDKVDVRMNYAVARATETELPLIYVNQVGGQDELVFDGGSFVLGADRRMVAAAKQFGEDLVLTEWVRGTDGWACASDDVAEWIEGSERLYQAMVLGLRDYVNKNGFPGVVLGLSGGIDSSLIVSLMRTHTDRPVRTFTIGFDEPGAAPGITPNDIATTGTRILLSSRAVIDFQAFESPDHSSRIFVDGQPAGWFVAHGDPLPSDRWLRDPDAEPDTGERLDLRGRILGHPWDLIAANDERIRQDIEHLFPTDTPTPGAHRIGGHRVSLGAGATIEP